VHTYRFFKCFQWNPEHVNIQLLLMGKLVNLSPSAFHWTLTKKATILSTSLQLTLPYISTHQSIAQVKWIVIHLFAHLVKYIGIYWMMLWVVTTNNRSEDSNKMVLFRFLAFEKLFIWNKTQTTWFSGNCGNCSVNCWVKSHHILLVFG